MPMEQTGCQVYYELYFKLREWNQVLQFQHTLLCHILFEISLKKVPLFPILIYFPIFSIYSVDRFSYVYI